MNEQDLFSGYDAYTTTAELGPVDDDAVEAGYTPSSAPCVAPTTPIRQTVAIRC